MMQVIRRVALIALLSGILLMVARPQYASSQTSQAGKTHMDKQIIQSIFQKVGPYLKDGWSDVTLQYKGDAAQAEFVGEYTVGGKTEYLGWVMSGQDISAVNAEFKAWQSKVTEMSGEPFTHCELRISSSGKFDADLSYDPIDWDVVPAE